MNSSTLTKKAITNLDKAISTKIKYAALLLLLLSAHAHALPRHAISMHGEPDLNQTFSHFPYANPLAPKGGTLRLAKTGSFDSLNPLVVKGASAGGVREFVYESLMARSQNEPFSLYGLIAENIQTANNRREVVFTIRKEARFSNDAPVLPEDIIFSAQTLRDKGRPNHRFYYSQIERVEKLAPLRVRFVFKPDAGPEMPLIIALMPILSHKHFLSRPFPHRLLSTPLGSGPYRIAEARPGRRIVFRRNPDYWGKNLPVNRGRFNPDRIVYDYYRDDSASFEAFKAGLYDVFFETNPVRWATGYEFVKNKPNLFQKQTFSSRAPAGMWALVFNTRRAIFADPKVRRAVSLAADFQWINKHLFHGAYVRTESFFYGSALSSRNRPANAQEMKLLQPFPSAVSPDILKRGFQPSFSPQSREKKRAVFSLLREAGWKLKNGQFVHAETEQPFRFEILVKSRDEERLALVFANRLKTLGIQAQVRKADSSRHQRRLNNFDYDMIFYRWGFSLSPGNEQSFYWSSEAANQPGSRNYPGVKNPAADALINALINAQTQEQLTAAARALDRVLLSADYLIPLFHAPGQWVASQKHVRRPDSTPLYGSALDTWWLNNP